MLSSKHRSFIKKERNLRLIRDIVREIITEDFKNPNKDIFKLFKLELINGRFIEKVVFSGTIEEINNYSKEQGLSFKKDNTMFGGHYFNDKGNSFSIKKN